MTGEPKPAKRPQNWLYQALFQAKQKEKEALFLAMQNALKKIYKENGSLSSFKEYLKNFEVDLEKIHLAKLERETKRNLTTQNFSQPHSLPIKPTVFKKEYQKLINKIFEIIDLLEEAFDPTEKQNSKILFAIRAALQNPSYQFLKEYEAHPAVQLLHSLCLSSYADPFALDIFLELGEHLAQVAKDENKENSFAEYLRKSHKKIKKEGLIEKDLSFQYAKYFFPHLWISLFSLYLGKLLTFFGFKGYDPRGDIQNNPQALYEEELSKKNRYASVRTFYTPTPTVGDKVAQEAEAVLMALENRYFLSKSEREKNPYPYCMWVYVNLQNITSYHEGFRSKALMQLQEKYPFSFRAITLSQDSSFYRAQVKAALKDDSPFTLAYKEEMQRELTHKDNFSLDVRYKKQGGGYFFPETIISKEILEKICDMAYSELFIENQKKEIEETRWNWMVKASFRELVTLGIIKYFQAKVALELMDKKPNEKVHLLATNTCKEGIDRGGKMNACLLWALTVGQEKEKQYVFSALHSRALLSRYRMVMPHRIEPMLSLIDVMDHGKLQNFLKRITVELLDIKSEETLSLRK